LDSLFVPLKRTLIAAGGHRQGTPMMNKTECFTNAEEARLLGAERNISIQRATIYMAIARSWTVLGDQMHRLAVIIKEEDA
jgi:hypothetical protein